MESFKKKKLDLSTINGGVKYNDGDGVSADTINSVVQSGAWVQALGETQPVMKTDSTNTPSVKILYDENGTPYFAFYNFVAGVTSETGTSNVLVMSQQAVTNMLNAKLSRSGGDVTGSINLTTFPTGRGVGQIQGLPSNGELQQLLYLYENDAGTSTTVVIGNNVSNILFRNKEDVNRPNLRSGDSDHNKSIALYEDVSIVQWVSNTAEVLGDVESDDIIAVEVGFYPTKNGIYNGIPATKTYSFDPSYYNFHISETIFDGVNEFMQVFGRIDKGEVFNGVTILAYSTSGADNCNIEITRVLIKKQGA